MDDLERRIVEALEGADIGSGAIAELLAATEAARVAAEQAVVTTRAQALDVTRSRDPKAALEALQAAELTRDRLQAALPRLQARYRAALEAEQYAAWLPTYEAAAAEQAALVQELSEFYQSFATKLVDLLLRIEQHRATAHAVNARKPSAAQGDGRHLSDQIVGAHILRDLKLPAWDPKAGLAWPPFRPIDPAVVAPIVPGDWRLTTARWHEVHAARAQAVREQSQRQRQQQEAAALENHRGPRWWEGELPGPERAL